MLVSESQEKFSNLLAELSDRAKVAETQAADASSETHEQLGARISDIKAFVKQRRHDLHARVKETGDKITSRWSDLRDDVHKKFGKLHEAIDKGRDDHDAKAAHRRADRAATNAAEAIDFALYAIDEAEASVLAAADARAAADALPS